MKYSAYNKKYETKALKTSLGLTDEEVIAHIVGSRRTPTPDESHDYASPFPPKKHIVRFSIETFVAHYKKNPDELVTYLAQSGGDVVDLCRRFVGDSREEQTKFLTQLLVILNHPGNSVTKAEWDALIEAYKQAKILTVQREAYEFFHKFQMPSAENTNLSSLTSFMRFWMAGHNMAETTRAKKTASTETNNQDSAELAQILSSLNNSNGGSQ